MLPLITTVAICLVLEGVFTFFKRRLISRSLAAGEYKATILYMPIYVPLVEPLIFTAIVGWGVAGYMSNSWFRFIAYAAAFYLSTMASIYPILEVEPASDSKRVWRGGKPLPLHKSDPNKLLFSESAGNVAVRIAWGSFMVGATIFWLLIW